MAAMRAFAVAAMLSVAVPATPDPVERWRAEIAEASARFGIPVNWITQVMRAESGGRPIQDGRPITSGKGAMGLMQLMPGTWSAMRMEQSLGADPYDPRDNILAGTAYLRAMYDRFGYPGLFAAYNAGPGRYADHLASGRSLPTETWSYLAQVTGKPRLPSRRPDRSPAAKLFVALRRDAPSANADPLMPASSPSPDPLFAVRANH